MTPRLKTWTTARSGSKRNGIRSVALQDPRRQMESLRVRRKPRPMPIERRPCLYGLLQKWQEVQIQDRGMGRDDGRRRLAILPQTQTLQVRLWLESGRSAYLNVGLAGVHDRWCPAQTELNGRSLLYSWTGDRRNGSPHPDYARARRSRYAYPAGKPPGSLGELQNQGGTHVEKPPLDGLGQRYLCVGAVRRNRFNGSRDMDGIMRWTLLFGQGQGRTK